MDDPYLRMGAVGRVRLLERIGEGGMGVVYKGFHDDLDLPVAVKFLGAGRLHDGQGAERFLREARLAARLNHPAIVRVFDCGELDGRLYIVMEFVDGQTLEAHIAERGAVGVARALRIAEEAAEALGVAWTQVGVIHRDVKPANIMLTSSGQVKLTDLGLAKMVAPAAPADQTIDYSSMRTEGGVILGTPAFMPPEQFLDAAAVDHRADIHALGATLYAMLTGRAPFQGNSIFSLMRTIERDPPGPLPPQVPLAVSRIVGRMMAKRPEDRYQTHAELVEDLRAAQRTGGDSSVSILAAVKSSSSVIIPAARASGQAIPAATPSENRVLLVVDMQNDFCPGGALGVAGGDELPAIISKLSRRFAHVILTQDCHPEDHLSFASSHPGAKPYSITELSYGPQVLWPDHCVANTPGAEFHPDLRVEHCEMILRKGYHREIDSYSAFFENDRSTPTGLAGYLRERGLHRLFLVGLATDFCVAYSALDARRLGFEVTVIEAACRGIDLNGSLEAAWEQMIEAGVIRA